MPLVDPSSNEIPIYNIYDPSLGQIVSVGTPGGNTDVTSGDSGTGSGTTTTTPTTTDTGSTGDGVDDDWFFGPYIIGASGEEAASTPILRGNAFVTACRKYATQYHIDVLASWANAMLEGIHGAIGDSGHAYGPWQIWAEDGRIPAYSGHELYDPIVQGWAWTANGIQYAYRSMYNGGAGGKTGHDAVHAIVYGFERPADEAGAYADRVAMYDKLHGMGSGVDGYIATNANGPSVLATAPAAPPTTTTPKAPSQSAWRNFMTVFSTQLPKTANRVTTLSGEYVGLVR